MRFIEAAAYRRLERGNFDFCADAIHQFQSSIQMYVGPAAVTVGGTFTKIHWANPKPQMFSRDSRLVKSIDLFLPMSDSDVQRSFDDDKKMTEQLIDIFILDVATIITQYASNSPFTTEMAMCLHHPTWVDVREFRNDGVRPVPRLMTELQTTALQQTVRRYYFDIQKAFGRGGHAYNTRSRKRKSRTYSWNSA
jgi:hypothetical protein